MFGFQKLTEGVDFPPDRVGCLRGRDVGVVGVVLHSAMLRALPTEGQSVK